MAEGLETARRVVEECVKAGRTVVLGFTGARFGGKTTFARRSAAAFHTAEIPCALVDAADTPAGKIEELLDHLVRAFTASPSAYGTVVFPRYLLARRVVAERIDPAESAAVTAFVRDILRSEWRAEGLPALIAGLADAVAQLLGVTGGGIGSMLHTLNRFAGRTSAGRRATRRPEAGWFAGNPLLDNAADPEAALVQLWFWCHEPGTGALRERADRVLTAAFLTDLRGSATAGTWRGNYALFIDNADHDVAAIRLAKRLVQELSDGDRVTVTATHRGALLPEIGSVLGGKIVSPAEVPFADPGDLPDATVRWRPLRLPDLTVDDVRTVLRERTGWPEQACQETAEAVHRFTRGHLGSTMALTGELAKETDPPDRGFALTGVLSEPVRDRLLADMLGAAALDGVVMDQLTTCAAVREQQHVHALVGNGLTAATLGRLLLDELWVPGGRPGHLVLLPPLRRLMLDRLIARRSGALNGWDAAYTHLSEYVSKLSVRDEESELYYALARGDAPDVIKTLWGRLADGTTTGWLDLLKHITCAPGRVARDDRIAEIRRHTAWAAESDPALQSLANLVVRLWLRADPLLPPLPDTLDISLDYKVLSLRFPEIAPELAVEAAWWAAAPDGVNTCEN